MTSSNCHLMDYYTVRISIWKVDVLKHPVYNYDAELLTKTVDCSRFKSSFKCVLINNIKVLKLLRALKAATSIIRPIMKFCGFSSRFNAKNAGVLNITFIFSSRVPVQGE